MASKSNERFRYGMCLNDECPLCKEKKVQQISMRRDFVCEECGKELREVRQKTKSKPKWPLFAGIGAAVVAIVVLCIVFIPSGDEPEVVEPAQVENTDSIAAAAAAEAAEAEAKRVADSIAAAAEAAAKADSIAKAKAAADAEKTDPKPTTTDPKGSVDYGKWSGAWKNGRPHGNGTMRYTKEHLIDSRDPQKRVAQPGDYIMGEFNDGKLVQGRWYDSANNVKGSIMIGM